MAHASESQHWYTKTGEPCYEVPAAKGGMRPATLRDARKLGLVPSVTSIIKCAHAEGLERWKREQILLAAMTLPRSPEQSESDWMEAVYKDAQEQGKKAAERGTAIHAAIQGAYEQEEIDPQYAAHVEGADWAVSAWMSGQIWDAERSFASPLGFGGKVDISCATAVADFKTTEKPLADLKTWDSHWMQLAAYRQGLGMPNARCAIVYVSVTNPGEARVVELTAEELDKSWKMFLGLLDYWYALKGLERESS